MVGRPLFNPVLRVLAYRWPVHRLSPRFKPDEAPQEPTFTLAFRNADLQVRFLLINAASARLLNLFQEHPELSGSEVVDVLANELSIPQETLSGFVRALVQDLHAQGAILGVVA